jgi:hypothetical protein
MYTKLIIEEYVQNPYKYRKKLRANNTTDKTPLNGETIESYHPSFMNTVQYTHKLK